MSRTTSLLTVLAAFAFVTGCGSKNNTKGKSSASASAAAGKNAGTGGGKGSLEDVPEGSNYVADNGFRPAKDGFKFPNPGGEGKKVPPPFGVKEAREMFGDAAVCERTTGGAPPPSDLDGKGQAGPKVQWIDLDDDGIPDVLVEVDPSSDTPDLDDIPGEPTSADPNPSAPPGADPTAQGGEGMCTPTPSALAWIKTINDKANGGLCEGFAVASLGIFKKVIDPVKYQPGAASAMEMEFENSRNMIAKFFAYQFTEPTQEDTFNDRKKMTPNDVLDRLIEHLKAPDPDEQVTLGFYQKRVGGHAVVPYAVEDKGGGKFWVRIYDNNYPAVSRYIEFDRNKNSWVYGMATINPTEAANPWGGDASTFTLDFTALRYRTKTAAKCPFCADTGGEKQVFAPESGDLLITDSSGNKIGLDKGTFINTIPGADELLTRGFTPNANPTPPIYFLPPSGNYEITIDGNGKNVKGDDIEIFGNGVAAVIDGLDISDDQVDKISITADGRGIRYTPGDNEAPVLRMAVDGADADYAIEVKDLAAGAGEYLEFGLDSTGKFRVFDSGGDGEKYDLEVLRFVAGDIDRFKNEDIDLGKGEADLIDFASWTGQGQAMQIGTDNNNDGLSDGLLQEADEN